MKIEFNKLEEKILKNFNNGEKEYRAHMYVDENIKIMKGKLIPGASIGLHTHIGTSEIIYVISGVGTMICDGKEEILKPGDAHYCPENSAHTFMNKTEEDLIFFAVVPIIN